MNREFQREAKRLAALPRAERFENLLDFPVRFTFKVIGRGQEFSDEVRDVLRSRGHREVMLVERPSAHGRYSAITFKLDVESGEALDAMYSALETLPNLAFLL